MDELLKQITSVVRGMWRFRWPALVASWIVGIIAVAVVFRIPDHFEASARVFVDTQTILKPLMAGMTVQPNVDQQVSMLSRTLISRPNIEKLVRMADLDLKSSTKGQQEQLIEELMRKISIGSTGRDNLYSLRYADEDRERAKRVVQSMVSIFVESSLGASRKDTDSAKAFLDEQIKSYEGKLSEAEARVKEFRLRNIEMQTSEGKDSASRLGELAQTLDAAKIQLREAENVRDVARKQLAAERGAFDASVAALKSGTGADAVTNSLLQESSINIATPEIDARIDVQRRNLDGLMQRYTDQHPDVIGTRRLLKDLEEQKKREVEQQRKKVLQMPPPMAVNGGSMAMLPTESPTLQELTRVAAAAEVQVAGLRARVSEYQQRYANARESSKLAPQIEAEAAQLIRDYGIMKKNYEDLVSRRQAANMSGEMEASGVAEFRLIDPPAVSPRPVSPNRLLLIPLALFASLVAGLGTAFVLSQLRPVFNDANELRMGTGLPILGVVSRLRSDLERRHVRMENMRFIAGSGGLLAGFLIAMATVSVIAARQLGS